MSAPPRFRRSGERRARRLAATTLAALGTFVAAAAAAVSVVDDTAATVSMPAPATRIVALAPHATELVYAAGAGASLVGAVKGSDFPPEARALPVVGDSTALDLETIVGLAPDLVVTWPWTSPAQVAWLRRRGIAVFEADAATVAGIADDVERIGALAGTSEVANAAAAALRGRIARIARAHAGVAPLRVFYQVADAPMYTLGGRHIVSRAIEACGGVNVFGALSLPAPQVGVEGVIAANPQVIIAGTEGAKSPPWLAAWRRWPAIDAVRRHALYAVDANWLHRPGPRFVDGVAQLCDVIAQARSERDAGGSIMSPVSRAQLPVLPGDPDRHSR